MEKDSKYKFIGLKQKVVTKILQMNFGVNRLFVLVYTSHGNNAKTFNARKYYLSKGIFTM